jgi:signal transduction histidine kinase/CheY-like chemotaxis protein
MRYQLPPTIRDYLEEIWFEQRALLCVQLASDGRVIQSQGQAEVFGISRDANEITDLIAGLSATESVIIPFVQFGNGRAGHLHHVYREALSADEPSRFVLLFTADNALSELGAQQQLANELTIANERQSQMIGALTQAQTLLRDSERELKRAHDLKSLFISKMSHEFGTPITAVLGRLKLLESAVSTSDTADAANEHLVVVRRGVQHLYQLVQSVLDEARLEQGTLRLEPSRVRIKELVDDLRELFSAIAQEKNLRFEATLEEDHLLWIDPLRVKQILINLVSNGIKYTPEGKVTLYVHWRDGKLTASVTDTGPGMSRDQASSLFQPFKRLSERTIVTGTGLGLAISRDLAQHMGGNIEVRSTLGEGSSFIFTLPCETIQSASEKSRALKILIVDDDTDIRELLCAVLSQEHHQIAEASNGAQAESAFRNFAPNVILLDMQLGTEHGSQVAKRLRKLGCTARIIGLSASNSGDTSLRALTAGCDAFLGKPVDFGRLKEVMQDF